jgi:hypothetical protein
MTAAIAIHKAAAARTLVSLAGLAMVLALPSSASAHGRIVCTDPVAFGAAVGIGEFDPIINPGIPSFGHEHTFLTNQRIARWVDEDGDRVLELHEKHRERSSYGPPRNIVGARTNCNNPDDTAAYWFPTLWKHDGPDPGDDRDRIRVAAFIAYYFPGSSDPGQNGEGKGGNQRHIRTTSPEPHGTRTPVKPFPRDMRLVAGRRDPSAPGGVNRYAWFDCGIRGDGRYFSPAAADCKDWPDDKDPHLMLKVWFPDCWDGERNPLHPFPGVPGFPPQGETTADHSDLPSVTNHLAYSTVADWGSPESPGDGRVECPVGYERKLPLLQLQVHFNYAGDGSDVTLGHAEGGMPWGDIHADFWNTWIQADRNLDGNPNDENEGDDLDGDGDADVDAEHGGLAALVEFCVDDEPVHKGPPDMVHHSGNPRCGKSKGVDD